MMENIPLAQPQMSSALGIHLHVWLGKLLKQTGQNYYCTYTCMSKYKGLTILLYCLGPKECCYYVTLILNVADQSWFQVNFDFISVDSQFPLFPSPNS